MSERKTYQKISIVPVEKDLRDIKVIRSMRRFVGRFRLSVTVVEELPNVVVILKQSSRRFGFDDFHRFFAGELSESASADVIPAVLLRLF